LIDRHIARVRPASFLVEILSTYIRSTRLLPRSSIGDRGEWRRVWWSLWCCG